MTPSPNNTTGASASQKSIAPPQLTRNTNRAMNDHQMTTVAPTISLVDMLPWVTFTAGRTGQDDPLFFTRGVDSRNEGRNHASVQRILRTALEILDDLDEDEFLLDTDGDAGPWSQHGQQSGSKNSKP